MESTLECGGRSLVIFAPRPAGNGAFFGWLGGGSGLDVGGGAGYAIK